MALVMVSFTPVLVCASSTPALVRVVAGVACCLLQWWSSVLKVVGLSLVLGYG